MDPGGGVRQRAPTISLIYQPTYISLGVHLTVDFRPFDDLTQTVPDPRRTAIQQILAGLFQPEAWVTMPSGRRIRADALDPARLVAAATPATPVAELPAPVSPLTAAVEAALAEHRQRQAEAAQATDRSRKSF